MLEYHKTILHKVSFSQTLFERELQKGLKSLSQDDSKKLLSWAKQMFGHQHQQILTTIVGEVEITR